MQIFNLAPRRKRSTTKSVVGLQIGDPGVLTGGYHRLVDAPEVAAAVWRISDLISSMSIHLMENSKNGDVRIRDALARKIDVAPWSCGTRSSWLSWIVTTMIVEGEAFVLPIVRDGLIADLEPMPDARPAKLPGQPGYQVQWRGQSFDSNDVLHFRYRPDPVHPWRGIGPQVQLQGVVDSIITTGLTKTAYMSSEYKPPLIVAVNSNSDLSDKKEREAFAESYLKRTDLRQPWIIPADMLNVVQAKPLSLTDLAIKDGVELDKKSVAALIGVPGFMVGVGAFSRDEYNTSVTTVVMPLCKTIQQELTKKLILSETRYFRMNVRSLYSYNLKDLADIGRAMHSEGLMTGNEVRNWLDLEPRDELDELLILENFIPVAKSGDQKKLLQEDDSDET